MSTSNKVVVGVVGFGGGGGVGLVVRAFAFHQCGPGSISAWCVARGLSLLVLYSVMRGFSPDTLVFPSHQNQGLIWFELI